MNENSTTRTQVVDRRGFLSAAVAAGLTTQGIQLGRPHHSRVFTAQSQTRPFVINMLGAISNPNLRLRPPPPEASRDAGAGGQMPRARGLDDRAIEDALASGVAAVNVTVGYVAGRMDPYEQTVSDIAGWNRVIHEYDFMTDVWSASDVERARAEGKIGIIQGFQNTEMLGEDAGRVEVFAGLGVKIIQLTYNVSNRVGHGSMVLEDTGLTSFGHEVVEAINSSNTLLDLSHSGEQTCLDALDAATAPVAITHAGCKALADMPRNKTDRELRLVAESGGIFGVYFMPYLREDSFPDANTVVRHIEHAIDVCGEDHVGIGTDGGTTAVDDLDAYREVINREMEQRRAYGIGATGEKPGVVPFVPDLQGPQQFQKLADMLSARGFPATRIEKVLGLNALRVMREVWGG